MPYAHLTETCFAPVLGESGLTEELFGPVLEAAGEGLEDLRRRRAAGDLPLLRLAEARDDLDPLVAAAARLKGEAGHVVVLGTGGSSLGGRAITALVDQERRPEGQPRVEFMDNLDAHSFARRLAALDPAGTAFVVISKSGSTMETMAQALVCLDFVRGAGGEAALGRQFLMVSEPGNNPLRRLAARFAIEVLDHDPKLGGRYSVLSLVGLLPALLVGLDPVALREGAAGVLDAALAAQQPEDAPPAMGAALAVALRRHRGCHINVLMPYADRLAGLAFWFRQLWAESLGKDGAGTTPVVALGPLDQHSQLQLYLGGPADKWFTLILPESAGRGPAVDGGLADDEALAYLSGHAIGDVVAAEQRATLETLLAHGRPTRVFRVPEIDVRTMGALFMHFMIETILAAHLLGVDPFDQPAVEEGKVLARRYLAEAAP